MAHPNKPTSGGMRLASSAPATARRPTTLTAVARPAGEVAGLLLWRSCAARGPGRPCSALPDR
jgi:hypothetical protein